MKKFVKQSAKSVFMVRPAAFGFNLQTAQTNSFQHNAQIKEVQEKALAEFDEAVSLIIENGIHVHVFEDSASYKKPDAIFPNNWFSTHTDGTLVLYPMSTPNRRLERQANFIAEIKRAYTIHQIIDLTAHEIRGLYLEGTGSIVFDHQNSIAYACLSPRTNLLLFNDICEKINYKPFAFSAKVEEKPIYHTNVMMCVSTQFCVVCLDSLSDVSERNKLLFLLEKSGKEVIEISIAQMNRFAGNMLELEDEMENKILVMSKSAHDYLNANQIQKFETYCKLIALDIPTIETIGGGSARCMMAENFLSSKGS